MIQVVSPTSGEDCVTELSYLPRSARILAIGNSIEDLTKDGTYVFSEVHMYYSPRFQL